MKLYVITTKEGYVCGITFPNGAVNLAFFEKKIHAQKRLKASPKGSKIITVEVRKIS